MHNFESPAHTHLVLYHANCVDGFAAAWVARKFLPVTTRFTPVSYGDIPRSALYHNKVVYIVDFSFPKEVLINIAQEAHKVVILDHHKTAQDILESWEAKSDNLDIHFDMTRSGAGMAWDYFSPARSSRPAFINYIEDRDLWKFSLPYSKEVNAYIALVPKAFDSYEKLSHTFIITMTDSGKYLLDQHQKFCEEIALDARVVHINQTRGLACNCTPQFSSEVGNMLAQKSGTYGATYYSTKDGSLKWSLRSTGNYDVSAIAKDFGGGGHKNAAGFTLVSDDADRSAHIKLWTLGE